MRLIKCHSDGRDTIFGGKFNNILLLFTIFYIVIELSTEKPYEYIYELRGILCNTMYDKLNKIRKHKKGTF